MSDAVLVSPDQRAPVPEFSPFASAPASGPEPAGAPRRQAPPATPTFPACRCSGGDAGECELTLGEPCQGPTVPYGTIQRFTADSSAQPQCRVANATFTVELWLEAALGPGAAGHNATAPPSPPPAHLILARGFRPYVTTQLDSPPSYFPPLSTASAVSLVEQDDTAGLDGTFAASKGWALHRRFHRVAVTHDKIQSYAVNRASPEADTLWRIGVAHIRPDSGSWGSAVPLESYVLRAACQVGMLTCARTRPQDPPCGGRGDCELDPNGLIEGASSRCVCNVDTARVAGYACNAPVTPLEVRGGSGGVATLGWLDLGDLVGGGAGGIAPGAWLHTLVKLPPRTLLVAAELERWAGNCLLLLRPRRAGFEPNDVPSLFDFPSFGDTEAAINRWSVHSRVLSYKGVPLTGAGAAEERVFVSVYNYAGDLAASNGVCSGRIRVRTQHAPTAAAAAAAAATDDLGGLQPLCPLDCTGQPCALLDPPLAATPVASELPSTPAPPWAYADGYAVCECEGARAGPWCGGEVTRLALGHWSPEIVLRPGERHYYTLLGALSERVTIDLQVGAPDGDGRWVSGGHALLAANVGEASLERPMPTILEHDFLLASLVRNTSASDGVHRVTLAEAELRGVDSLNFTAANLNIFTDGDLPLRLRVYGRQERAALPGRVVAGIVVAAVVVLLVAAWLIRRIARQLSAHAHAPQIELLPLQPVGLSADAIDRLEAFKCADAGRIGVTPAVLRNGGPDCDLSVPPACPICSDDYDPDAVLRRLPCSHIYHQECIDRWLGKHATCPICRLNLHTTSSRAATASSSRTSPGSYGASSRAGSRAPASSRAASLRSAPSHAASARAPSFATAMPSGGSAGGTAASSVLEAGGAPPGAALRRSMSPGVVLGATLSQQSAGSPSLSTVVSSGAPLLLRPHQDAPHTDGLGALPAPTSGAEVIRNEPARSGLSHHVGGTPP